MLPTKRSTFVCLLTCGAACTQAPAAPRSDTVVLPSASSAAPAVPPASHAAVLFAVGGDGAAPIACFDGRAFLPTDSADCMHLAPKGARVSIAGSGEAVLGDDVNVPCNGSQLSDNSFAAQALLGNQLAAASWAVWPVDARDRVKPDAAKLRPTQQEQTELDTLLISRVTSEIDNGIFTRSKTVTVGLSIAVRSGLTADLDGDGRSDRVFAGYQDARMVGMVAVFLGKDPSKAVLISADEHDFVELAGTTDLDADGARELWIDASFLEDINDAVVTSAVSVRLVRFEGGASTTVGSWGCRMF